jgi:hypothetical protein
MPKSRLPVVGAQAHAHHAHAHHEPAHHAHAHHDPTRGAAAVACDCAGHRALATRGSASSLWASLLPVLACAICPACLTTYAKILAVFGVGFGLSELEHLVLLVVAVGTSVAVSAWRTVRSGRAWPLVFALSGSALVVLGHVVGDLHVVEWTGVLVMLAGGLGEHFRLVRAARTAAA